MPIYEQSYRSYDGELRRRFRWWVMVRQELKVLFTSRLFMYLLMLAVIHVILRVLQIVAYDIMASDPNNPVTMAMRNIAALAVDPQMFFDFIRIQAPLVFLLSIFAGAGLICNDFRNNLVEVYFGKPLSWRDYLMGKVGTLMLVGLMVTAVPALFLLILHNLLAPGMKTIQETWWLPLPITLFSLAIVMPCALCVLLSSALSHSQNFAGIAVLMVALGNSFLGVTLAETLLRRSFHVLSFPLAVNRVGELVFRVRRPAVDISPGLSVAFVLVVCVAALLILARRIRKAEFAA